MRRSRSQLPLRPVPEGVATEAVGGPGFFADKAERYPGPVRVVEDVELYHGIMGQQAECGPEELRDYVRCHLDPWTNTTLAVMAMRARLFLGCIRMELGRRQALDPEQLRLKGM